MKIVGWITSTVSTSSCEQSNVGVTSWTNIASLPIALQSLAMVTLLGKAYVFGGYNTGGTTVNSVYMYDGEPAWVAKAAMSTGRSRHAALALDNDRALVCGGVAPTTAVSTCDIYTASTDIWTTLAPTMAQVRANFNLVMSEGIWR
jgi:N-acetylneuraminic acid mutarotase